MKLLECVERGIFYLDGGTGTSLQAMGLKPGELPELWNLSHPENITALGKAYFEAGSHMICANTFGANCLKYDGREGRPTVQQVVTAAVTCAQKARDTAEGGQPDKFITLDIGPLGRMLEPLGDLPFERAVEIFAETVRAGVAAGVDCIKIATMNDAYETKAAVLAAKEWSNLPVFATNVYDESGKVMSGGTPEAMVALLEGLGVDVIGANCSLGPAQMLEILPRLTACCSKPVLMKPNAGMPRSVDGRVCYDVDETVFADYMKQMIRGGARVIGGCCGTTPDYIRAMVRATSDMDCLPVTKKHRTVVSSYAAAVELGKRPVMIGERINPTGKKRCKEALRSRDMGYLLSEAIAQEEHGAQILDVNVGLPEIDEPELLTAAVREIQAVTALPLQLDTADPAAMARAMRVYNGKPMLNSVNGKRESMEQIFPLVKKYGGVVVCLTLDESGIPETARGRLEIARRIQETAAGYGIGPEDLIFDPLAMTISSDSHAAMVTLEAVRLIREELGGKCILGVSNVSFGLPNRSFVTGGFLSMALYGGLSAAIMDPLSAEVQKAYRSALALLGADENCGEYIAFAKDIVAEGPAQAPKTDGGPQGADKLQSAIIHGLREEAARQAMQALVTEDGLTVINERIIPALDAVGQGFEAKTIFLPQLLMSAEAAKAAFDEVRKTMPASETKGPGVLIATVKGDIHDIGKNIVKVLLENYGYDVADLGKNVSPEEIVETAVARDIRLVGLSALMTTTVPAMKETIALMRSAKPDCKIAVGGAVLTQEYADMIGADFYARTAMDTVRYAETLFSVN